MTDIKMPQLGESVTEGTVGRWLKQVGEPVAQYEPLLEVLTDKVDTEVPAPSAGVLAEILVAEGTTVRVGTVIARLAHAGQSSQDQHPSPLVEQPVAQPRQPGAVPTAVAAPPPARAQAGAPPISPVVARLAAEHQLDLRQIQGTGAGGRVSKQDVLRFLAEPQNHGTAEPEEPRTKNPEPILADEQRASVIQTTDNKSPATSHQPPATVHPPPSTSPDDELIPLTPMRRAIAEHMTRSVNTAPHVTTIFEVDMGRITAHRLRARDEHEQQGVRLTYTAYLVQAVARALRTVRVLNGRYTEDGILVSRRIHIGVAVALDEGLLVPVIRDADEKSLLGIARALGDLSERARTRRLNPDEVRGGTFSISNHGVGGSLIGTPIINQPQSGILGVGAIVKRPVVIEQDGGEAIAIRPMCYLALTFDHRVCDGADADRFLSEVKRFLEGYN
jgi:2-oxoisovalerate dehydrogenase E2 component (dihydrolipoyl transacylase)